MRNVNAAADTSEYTLLVWNCIGLRILMQNSVLMKRKSKLPKRVRRTQSVKFTVRNPRAKKDMDYRRSSGGFSFAAPKYTRNVKYNTEW